MTSRAPSSHTATLPSTWPGRGHVAIFVRCLHLLDLDLLDDWPPVTEQLFTAKAAQQSLQQRVKAVEWSLYRLFEAFDSEETKDKLRPFFPPATQLQSLNLRAALYRCMTDLKKNGVLGKDVVLRKTMLDDCKGERFEEVLSGFAMSVLRRKTTTGLPYASTRDLSDAQLLPIIIAYRASVQTSIVTRKGTQADAGRRWRTLVMAEHDLQERLEHTKQGTIDIDTVKQNELQAAVNSNWIGERGWTDLLLRGVPARRVLEVQSDKNRNIEPSSSQALLADLETRLKRHQARVSEWKLIAKDLTRKQALEKASRPTDARASQGVLTDSSRFTKHKALDPANWKASASLPVGNSLAKPYEELLYSMRQELDGLSSRTKKESPGTPLPPATWEGSTTFSDLPQVESGSSGHAEENSKNHTPLSVSVDDNTSVIESEAPESSVSPSPTRSSDNGSSWIPKQQSGTVTVDNERIASVDDHVRLTSDGSEPPMSPSSLWMSLADRTRASMSLTGRQSMLPDPDSPENQHFGQIENLTTREPPPPSGHDRHATLIERTRMSMSTLSNSSASRLRKANNSDKRPSQTFPVNQFETSDRSQRHSEITPECRTSTPQDQLLEEDADYASVFRSRPKLAMSPGLSPEQKSSALGSILEQDVDHVDLNSG